MLQPSIQFAVKDQFRENIRNGKFSLMTELNTPLKSQQFSLAITPMRASQKVAAQHDIVATTLILDRCKGEDSYSPANLQPLVCELLNKAPIVTISGKGSNERRVAQILQEISGQGTKTFLAVTGDRSDLHTDKKQYSGGYFDSIETIKLAKEFNKDCFIGATVNPFKYDPSELLPQYCKMMKKIKHGADFIITQAGWDMAKFQELQWYMKMRGMATPVIARVMIPTFEDIKNIGSGIRPGVHVSKLFAAVMEREATVNYEQALAAHLHRVGLIAAGCKLLGYSGVSFCGPNDERTTSFVLKKTEAFILKYNSWEEWLKEWNRFHADIRFAPENHNYYFFSDLLSPNKKEYDSECSLNEFGAEPIEFRKKLRYHISNMLKLDRSNGPIYGFLKMAMYKSLSCDRKVCYLPKDKCPKGLIEGPCGGTYPGGKCEFKQGGCLFSRQFAFVNWLNKIDTLEE